MKKLIIAIIATAFMAAPALAADIMLTTPQTEGGPSVLAAIEGRSSAAQTPFQKSELTVKELSTLLWAATGRNRGGQGWTVPYAMGRDPYVNVYVMLKSGSYRYDTTKNMLLLVGDKNDIARAGTQDYVGTAPCVLVFAVSGTLRMDAWGDVAAGAMAQNIYLAAEALGLKTRYVQSFNRNALFNSLQIGPLGKILCIMPVGRQ